MCYCEIQKVVSAQSSIEAGWRDLKVVLDIGLFDIFAEITMSIFDICNFSQTIWLSFSPHKIYNICAKMYYFSQKIDDFSTKLWIFGFNLKFLHIAEKALHRHHLCCLWQISSMTMWDDNISIKEPVSDFVISI